MCAGWAPCQGRRWPVQCASLKSNLGHLEAAAAAAGLASLAVGPLSTGIVVVNAQLRGLAAAAWRRSFESIDVHVGRAQVERPPVVRRVVARVVVPRARRSDGSSDSRHVAEHVAAELVRLQRDHRPRGVRRCVRGQGRSFDCGPCEIRRLLFPQRAVRVRNAREIWALPLCPHLTVTLCLVRADKKVQNSGTPGFLWYDERTLRVIAVLCQGNACWPGRRSFRHTRLAPCGRALVATSGHGRSRSLAPKHDASRRSEDCHG